MCSLAVIVVMQKEDLAITLPLLWPISLTSWVWLNMTTSLNQYSPLSTLIPIPICMDLLGSLVPFGCTYSSLSLGLLWQFI